MQFWNPKLENGNLRYRQQPYPIPNTQRALPNRRCGEDTRARTCGTVAGVLGLSRAGRALAIPQSQPRRFLCRASGRSLCRGAPSTLARRFQEMGHSVARICARQEPSCEAAEPGECTLQSTVASHHMASSRRACLRGVPIARLLPVLLVLCESNITAETVVPAGTAEAYRPAGALGCRRLGAFVPPSSAGCAHRLEAALMRDSRMISARRVGAHRRGLSLLASHAGGFGARITGGFGDDKTTALHMTKTVTKEKAPSQPVLRDVLGDETDSFSAQERRMLGVLSKYGRLHTPESSAGRVGSSPQKSVKSVRVQKEEMAKDRRDEKVALRRRQGTATAQLNKTCICT